MSPDSAPPESPSREKVMRWRGVSGQLQDFDLNYVAHPLVALVYLIVAPVYMVATVGVSADIVWWELIAASMVAIPVIILFRRPLASLRPKHVTIRIVTITGLIVVTQILARVLNSDHILEAVADRAPAPPELVVTAAVLAYAVQHILVWFLLVVLVSGSLSYRVAKKSQRELTKDITNAQTGVTSETELAAKQRESVGEISRRVDAIEQALREQPGRHLPELTHAVRELRQEVVRPSLEQLNALLAAARSAPHVSSTVVASVSQVPWRWQGRYFSGTVGALLIGAAGILLLAPTAYYQIGNFIQMAFIASAFFVSVPASLFLFFAAALTPVFDPSQDVFGGLGLIALIALLGGISFLQRFNRVRQVRAVESMSVASAQLALDQVRRAQDLKVIEERVNSILHGSVQSTLLALELGLQSSDDSVTTHSHEALEQLRQAVAKLDEPVTASGESFERALGNIISVWEGSLRVTVDQSPDAAAVLNNDPLAASAVIEVVKEGTQNAAKHSDSKNIRVVIGVESSLVRVRVSHRSSGQLGDGRGSGLGMAYLGAITRTLRLVDDGHTTTLYAEIPTSQIVTPGS